LKLLQKERANLLITDIQMPGMNGVDLILKTHETYPDLEVIAVSDTAPKPRRTSLRRIGVFGYVENRSIRSSLRRWRETPLRAIAR